MGKNVLGLVAFALGLYFYMQESVYQDYKFNISQL